MVRTVSAFWQRAEVKRLCIAFRKFLWSWQGFGVRMLTTGAGDSYLPEWPPREQTQHNLVIPGEQSVSLKCRSEAMAGWD